MKLLKVTRFFAILSYVALVLALMGILAAGYYNKQEDSVAPAILILFTMPAAAVGIVAEAGRRRFEKKMDEERAKALQG